MTTRVFNVTTDPDKPCRREFRIRARSMKDAARRAVLAAHDEASGCPIVPSNIGTIEQAKDRGDVNYVVTVVPTHDSKPAAIDPRFEWLRVDGVWFWCECIVRAA